jgi:hypothetical protein
MYFMILKTYLNMRLIHQLINSKILNFKQNYTLANHYEG